ncbi:MAG TPA: serine protease [Candidatus Paceibacterota bacterium]
MKSLHLIITALIVATSLLSYISYEQMQQTRYIIRTNLQESERIDKHIKILFERNDDLERAIVEKDKVLAKAIEDERSARKLIETQAKISNLSSQVKIAELSKTIEAGKLPSTSEIVDSWSSRIARISCDFGKYTSSGSGLLARVPQGGGVNAPRVITSKHVVIDELGRGAIICTSTFTNGAKVVSRTLNQEVEISKAGYDFGYLISSNWSNLPDGAMNTQLKLCSNTNVRTGDAVLVLGYPSIGSDRDLTVTEGIVSGREGDYFVTSAKVERGNSGGAAVLIRENCYLGIPTFVETGGLESLARILDASLLGI